MYTCNFCHKEYEDPKECFECINLCFYREHRRSFVYDVQMTAIDGRLDIGVTCVVDQHSIIPRGLEHSLQSEDFLFLAHTGWLFYDQLDHFVNDTMRDEWYRMAKDLLLKNVDTPAFEDKCELIDTRLKQLEEALKHFWPDALSQLKNSLRLREL